MLLGPAGAPLGGHQSRSNHRWMRVVPNSDLPCAELDRRSFEEPERCLTGHESDVDDGNTLPCPSLR